MLGMLLLSFINTATKCQIFIKPSTSTDCPVALHPCLTIEKFVTTLPLYHGVDTTLKFLPGNHILTSTMSIQNINSFTMQSVINNTITIVCNQFAGFEFSNISDVKIQSITFSNCGEPSAFDSTQGRPVFNIQLSVIKICASTFSYSKGKVIHAWQSNIIITKCLFQQSTDGVIYAYGGIIILTDNTFSLNRASNGELVHANNISATVDRCVFSQNIITNIGILSVNFGNLTMTDVVVINNEVGKYGVLFFSESQIESYGELIFTGNRAPLSTFTIYVSKVKIVGNIVFSNNSGVFHSFDCQIIFSGSAQFSNSTGVHTNNNKYTERGGAITSIQSIFYFTGRLQLSDNYSWKSGGAIAATYSKLYIATAKAALIFHNIAFQDGGGIYLDHCEFICKNCTFSGNTANERGGAIHAYDSIIGNQWSMGCEQQLYTSTSLSFENNRADRGGGLSFTSNSKLYSPKERNYSL